MIAHFFDIDTLIKINNKVWIVDKNNPNIPIIKISTSDFNLIKNGVYKSQGNKVEYNGQTFWLPIDIFNKLKVKLKLNNGNLSNIGISMQEFLNKEIIDNIEFSLNLDNITHLKNKTDDIYIICSKQNKKNYETVLESLTEKLKEEGIKVKNFYYISETFYNQNDDDIRFNKIKLLLQHLVGYKTFINKFTDEEITRYNTVHFYDNQYDTIKVTDEANTILKSILNKTEDGLKSVIREDISEYRPTLIVNQITDNEINRKLTRKVIIEYSNLIKTFESFKLILESEEKEIPENFANFIKKCMIYDYDDNDSYKKDQFNKLSKSLKFEDYEKWVNIVDDIDDVILEISDTVGPENIAYHLESFGIYSGYRDVDCIRLSIDAGEDKGFKDFIKINYLKEIFKRRLPQLIIYEVEYSDNERFIDDDEPIVWSTTVKIFFRADLKKKRR